MEPYLQISKLNDFVFCPRSIYLHDIYSGFNERSYHSKSQTAGKIKHEKIDQGSYSTRKDILQGIEIYSQKFGLAGKIDIYDQKNQTLIERKSLIKKIYDGYLYQIYAQYFCLKEMGLKVKKIFFHSLDDNKRIAVPLPDKNTEIDFGLFVKKIKNFNIKEYTPEKNPSKCANCIYNELCF